MAPASGAGGGGAAASSPAMRHGSVSPPSTAHSAGPAGLRAPASVSGDAPLLAGLAALPGLPGSVAESLTRLRSWFGCGVES